MRPQSLVARPPDVRALNPVQTLPRGGLYESVRSPSELSPKRLGDSETTEQNGKSDLNIWYFYQKGNCNTFCLRPYLTSAVFFRHFFRREKIRNQVAAGHDEVGRSSIGSSIVYHAIRRLGSRVPCFWQFSGDQFFTTANHDTNFQHDARRTRRALSLIHATIIKRSRREQEVCSITAKSTK